MEPLNHLMAAAQSLNLQRTEPNNSQRHVQQQSLVVENQHKVQETVTSIAKDSNDADEMMSLRSGLGGQGSGGLPSKKQRQNEDEETAPEKALLTEESGRNLDIIG